MMMPAPDPTLQAIIDASHQPVDLAVLPDLPAVVCGPHKSEKCETCKQDYVGLNRLAKILHQNPSLTAPPPANVVSKNLSVAVGNTKEEGNVRCLLFFIFAV
jgi:translocation protein SEC72